MNLKEKNIGFAFSGSFSAFRKTIEQLKELKKIDTNIIPIMSFNSYCLNTKFDKAQNCIDEIEKITCKKIIHSIPEAEFISSNKLDILIIAPCSGNTISKLACNITDTPITVAVNTHLKYNKPVVIAVSTANGLSSYAENIGKLLNRKNYYFVPFKQSNPITNPTALIFDSSYIIKTLEYALDKEQIQPILLQV